MAAFYGLTDAQIMQMPIKRFWLFSETIDRLQAAEDLRRFNLNAISNTREIESVRRFADELNDRVGTVTVKDYERDAEGIKSLKRQLMGL